MPKKRPSFFERLTGAIRVEDDNDTDEEITINTLDNDDGYDGSSDEEDEEEVYDEEDEESDDEDGEREGRLAVDLFETRDELILKTMVAGLKPDDLDVVINRQTVKINGFREGERNIDDEDYVYQEIFWGAFSRTVSLPEEIEVEESEAVEKNGLLTIRMPKVNKDKEAKIKVKTS